MKEEAARFRSAIKKDYYFQMYYDDLPIWAFTGKINQERKEASECKYCLFKHVHFDIDYKDRVIEINVRVDPNMLANLTEDQAVEVEFLYTVTSNETNILVEKRMDKYSQYLGIHWFFYYRPIKIPPLPWYPGAIPQMAMARFLPFIEVYYMFASVWGHKIYTIYSILFVIFIILLIVTAFITVGLTYFQLAAEDHEWWWRYVDYV
ncbi:hypothetical protein Patl1_35667 [Pistacia atlantica]|nr:hypothetical protein Patl1_35667 [Pistacia atlantica]